MIVTPEGSPYPNPESDGSANAATGPKADDATGGDHAADSDNAGNDRVIDRVVHGVHQAVDRMAEKAVPTAERVKSGVSGAAEAVQSQADHLGEMQEEWVTACRDCVRAHPLKSVGAAVVAGMILSRILR